MAAHTRQIMIRENRIIIALLSILSVIAIGMVLYQTRSIILPFALAVFINYIISPLITFFERRRIPSAISILLAIIITFLILNFVGVMIYTSIKSFTADFPKYEDRFNQILQQILQLTGIPEEVISTETQGLQRFSVLANLKGFSLSKIIVTTFSSLLNFLSNTFLVLLFLFFMLLGRNQLARKVQLAFRPEVSIKIAGILNNINRQIQKYLLAKTIISFITGVLSTGILMYFGVEFALVWGMLTFLLNFIPNLGSVIATALPVAFAFIQMNDLVTVMWIFILLVAVQMIMGNFLDPRIVGRSLNLSPLVVLFSLIFWGWLWGIVGMFLAVPISVIIKIIFENIESLRFISVLMSSR
ncbi:MAG: AI-2E family transporter [Calditrichaeota bacterium]|nr:AI-2E family transporter [Calditrichota bacterium]